MESEEVVKPDDEVLSRGRTRAWFKKFNARKDIKESQQKYAERNRKKISDRCKRYREDPEVKKRYKEIAIKKRKEKPWMFEAKNKVTNALKSGKLEKAPCAVCGSEKVEAHHEDYGRPIDVIWLCKSHHKIRHSQGFHKLIEMVKTQGRKDGIEEAAKVAEEYSEWVECGDDEHKITGEYVAEEIRKLAEDGK